MSSQTIWSNERVLQFLELYQAETVLWNPMVRDHKNRNVIADAWQRILSTLNVPCTVTDLKKKRESLMSTYRLYKKKIKDSIRSGASADEIYKSNWFAFNFMDSFLGCVYDKEKNETINTETLTFTDENATELHTSNETDAQATNLESQSTPNASRKRRNTELIQAKKQMDQAVNVLKTISERSHREPDEVDLFCQLMAKKIKKIHDGERDQIMREIDNLLYSRLNYNHNDYRITPSPQSNHSLPTRLWVSTPLQSPSSSSQHSQQECVSDMSTYIQVEPHFSKNVQSSELNQTRGTLTAVKTHPKVNIISNDIIQQAFQMSENNSNFY